MMFVPWWAVLSSACAPFLLVGGWSIAAELHGPGYDPVTETISVMAAYGASGRWVLTGVLFVLGLCHLVTAWGLRPAALAGRAALACGGVAVIGMGLSPVPESGGSEVHGWVAAVGFALMALWPVLASDRDGAAPWGLRPALSLAVCLLMGLGAAWFLIELHRQGGAAGVAERVLTTAQTAWPFVVVASCRGRAALRTDELDERDGRGGRGGTGGPDGTDEAGERDAMDDTYRTDWP
ncbi:DUF998 domain-containing protein [Streptomyces luteolus]|uniref:DUF998 domain-containing protein n=1 Tax=Streptomyces luteolus TaxID=3043615 RepID=A0ABT6SSH2_9ACTN|nr:DUF998 domain-containing protein [Streptomyces sp. B-S-A12]MDI3417804.1 DUF998 domain-containing protein [Streptomyces sp. B-S-A12]